MMTPLSLSYTLIPEALSQFPFSANEPTQLTHSNLWWAFVSNVPAKDIHVTQQTGKRMGGREKDNPAIC